MLPKRDSIMASRTSAALSGSVARSTLSEKALCRQWAGFSVCGRSNAFGFDTPCSRGFGNKGLNGGDFALDAAPSGCPPLALHRWLATPQGASAPASSRCVGSAWKPGASRQRPSPTTSRRIEAISPLAILSKTRRIARMALIPVRLFVGCCAIVADIWALREGTEIDSDDWDIVERT